MFELSRDTIQGNHHETRGTNQETQVYQPKEPKLPSRGTRGTSQGNQEYQPSKPVYQPKT